MSIATKTGDNGETSLFGGARVSKENIRVEAYGTIDELNSFLGLTKNLSQPKNHIIIEKIQKQLFQVGAMLATPGENFSNPIMEEDLKFLDDIVESLEKKVNLSSFVIPGENLPSAYFDVCRTIARRAERRIVQLKNCDTISGILIKYANRLSDVLFLLAQIEAKKI
ncbi:MAG: cob(I)yrinic acid a,c-diamide adenosyltransferase [Candidatus Riflebacteria bacterium]|nr:cob(I)yrinic acid a,c-diamide adenosyltransferase [Candidatus Riflebacteria bacterium]